MIPTKTLHDAIQRIQDQRESERLERCRESHERKMAEGGFYPLLHNACIGMAESHYARVLISWKEFSQ